MTAKLELQGKALIIKGKGFTNLGPGPTTWCWWDFVFYTPHLYFILSLCSLPCSLLPWKELMFLKHWYWAWPCDIVIKAIHIQTEAFHVIIWLSPALEFLPWEQILSKGAAPSAWIPEWEDVLTCLWEQSCCHPAAVRKKSKCVLLQTNENVCVMSENWLIRTRSRCLSHAAFILSHS